MPDYQNGKIYKIVCDTTNKVYYGSTTKKYLSSRLNTHKHAYLNNLNSYTSRYVLEGGNYSIILVENYPCNSKDELHQRERYYIENNNCVNRVNPYISNIEKIENKKQVWQNWYSTNKDILKEKKQQKINCECGGLYTHNHKSTHYKTKKHLDFINNN